MIFCNEIYINIIFVYTLGSGIWLNLRFWFFLFIFFLFFVTFPAICFFHSFSSNFPTLSTVLESHSCRSQRFFSVYGFPLSFPSIWLLIVDFSVLQVGVWFLVHCTISFVFSFIVLITRVPALMNFSGLEELQIDQLKVYGFSILAWVMLFPFDTC